MNKEDSRTMLTYLETKPYLHEIDFRIKIFESLSESSIHDLPNLLVYGVEGCGKSVKIYSFLSSLLKTKDIYNIKVRTFEEERRELTYRYSPYHIEFSPLDLASNEYIFIIHFLGDYVKMKNVGFDIPKIIYIKNADCLSKNSQMALRKMMEQNIDSCRFIFECKNLSSIIEPLRSRFLMIRVENPSLSDLKTVIFSFTKKYFDKDLKEEEYLKIIEMSRYYQYNMKHIFGILVCYLTTGDFLRLSYVDKMREIFEMMTSLEFYNDYFEKIRDIVQELYIELIPMSRVCSFLLKELLDYYQEDDKLYPDRDNMLVSESSLELSKKAKYLKLKMEIIKKTVYYDTLMKNGNKLSIHLESYIIDIIRIIHHYEPKTFSK